MWDMILKAMKTMDGARAGLRLWAALLGLGCLAQPLQAQVVINEVMTDNATAFANEDIYPDWVELYNTSTSAVDLGGWTLTDTPTNTARFVFPAGTRIAGRGYLIVFCDDAFSYPGLHTGFGLGRKGGFVGLYQAGILKDSVIYGLQPTDYTIGRMPNGTGGFTLTLPTPGAPNQAAPLSPPLGNLRINEWTATNSLQISGGKTNETPDWLELYNLATNPVSLAGMVFTTYDPPVATDNKVITNLSFIGPRSFIKFDCVGRGKAGKNDELDFKLSHNTGELVTLFDSNRVTIIEQISFPGVTTIPGYWAPDVSYGRLPDGATNGYYVHTAYPYNRSTNWVRFSREQTTPGASNLLPLTNVVINEVLAHTDPPFEDAIELFNPTPQPVNIGGFWISNDKDVPKKFRIPPGTVLPPYGFTNFYECVGCSPGAGFNWSGTGTGTNFTLNSAHGDAVYVFAADAAGNLTGYRADVDFSASFNRVSYGRYVTSEGKTDFVPMSRTTFGMDNPTSVLEFRLGKGLSNAYPRVGPLVITEIHYHPPDLIISNTPVDDSLNEFIELYNASTAPLCLWDTNGLYYAPGYPPWNTTPYADGRTNTWRIRGDIDFDFPTNVTVPPGGFLLLVNFDPVTNLTQLAAFTNKFKVPPGVPILGPYKGKLANSSAQIEIKAPDAPQGPQHPDFRYVPYVPIERIKYYDDPPWPTNADGRGMSLNRVKIEDYANDPINWEEGPPTPGRQHLKVGQLGFDRVNRRLTLQFKGWAYASYSVVYSTSLTSGVWFKVPGGDVPPQTNTGPRTVVITNLPSGSTRFYRIVSPQQP